MRAARLHEGETNLKVEELPTPTPPAGCALVRIESVFVTPYLASLIDGSGGFETPPRPFTPGSEAIGRVEAVAADVEGLSVGARVYCDPYVEAPAADGSGQYAFVGCFPISAGAGPLLARWPDGALATHMILPAECLTDVGPALAVTSADTLARLGWFGTAHSAFAKTDFQPGGSVAVLGATGLLGISAVLVALAMGAGRVVAVGRSAERLAAFAGLDPRIETATRAPDGIDLAINAMDGSDRTQMEAALAGLNRHGALVVLASLGGAVELTGMVGRDITLRGSLWFPRETTSRLVRLIAAGALPTDRISSHVHGLDDVDGALAHAARKVAPFEQVVVRP